MDNKEIFISRDVEFFEENFPFLNEKNKSFVERESIGTKLFLSADGGKVHSEEIVLGSTDFGETRPTENSGPGLNPTGQTGGQMQLSWTMKMVKPWTLGLWL